MATNLILNPTFADHAADFCSSNWCLLTNAAAIAPWFISSSYKTFELDSKATWSFPSANWTMDLSSDQPYTIAQTVATVSGATYHLTFDLNQNACGSDVKTGFVRATGAPTLNIAHTQSLNGASTVTTTYRFKATATSTTIEIGSTTAGGCGLVVSNFLIASQPANMISNPGFADHAAQYCQSSWCMGSDPGAIAPWVVTSTSKSWELDHTVWANSNSDWSMDLNSDQPYTVGQTVATTVGVSYVVTFDLNENGCGSNPKTGFVRATGATPMSFTHDSSVMGTQWFPFTYRFTATAASTLIEIGSTTTGGCGPVLDNVYMAPQPANLIANPTFMDTAANYCQSSWCAGTDPNAIAPWTITSVNKQWELDKNVWAAPNSDWSMDLSSYNPYTIGQTVSTTIGLNYTLVFDLSQNSCGPATKSGFVRATGNPQVPFFHIQSVTGVVFVPITYRFTAQSAVTLIEVGSTTDGGCGPAVGNFYLGYQAPAPAPAVQKFNAISTATTVATDNRTLILSTGDGFHDLPAYMLSGYKIAYDVFNVTSSLLSGLLPLESTTTRGKYNLIILANGQMAAQFPDGSFQSTLSADQWSQLWAYQLKYNVRIVKLHDMPGSGITAGQTDRYNGQWGTGDTFNISATIAAASYMTAAGLSPTWSLDTTYLFSIPATITNTSSVTPLVYFVADVSSIGVYPANLTAACVYKLPGGHEQLSIFMNHATWAPANTVSVALGHIWVAWGTKGFYDSSKRYTFSAGKTVLARREVADESFPKLSRRSARFAR